LTPLAETGDLFSDLALFPSVNDEETAVFGAALTAGGSGIFAATDGGVTSLIDANAPFESFRGVLINRAGLVAFTAVPRGGRLGVFAGADPIADRIVCLGDPLFGSTVTGFALNPVSVNEAAQLAIRVRLADDRQAVVRVDPAR
jgi:hypothetical protein